MQIEGNKLKFLKGTAKSAYRGCQGCTQFKSQFSDCLDHWFIILSVCLEEFDLLAPILQRVCKKSCDRSGVYVSKMCMW